MSCNECPVGGDVCTECDDNPLRCYKCGELVGETEQQLATHFEEKIMYGIEMWSELYSDEFVHCTGPEDRFYDTGAPVVCLHCVLTIGADAWLKTKKWLKDHPDEEQI